jgi:tRNA(Ile)-lysidine synthase
MLNESTFQEQIEKTLPFYHQKKYLLAVSGGVDSMVLCYLFLKLKIEFQIAHINYKLREESSDLDQKVVEDFAKKNKIKLHVYEASEKDNKPENSIQLWAREIRYQFFNDVKNEENLDFLVTAHHLNDQLETFIINLSKASGIDGLCGIPSDKNEIIRPLLQFSKKEIYDFANENKIEFREDESNKKNDYLRNKIRNKITPLLLETNESFLDNFSESINHLNAARNFIAQQIKIIIEEITLKKTEREIVLNKEKLFTQSDFVIYEILKDFGFNKEEEIQKIKTAETGAVFYSKQWKLLVNRNELIIFEYFELENDSKKIEIINESDLQNLNHKFSLKSFIESENEFSWDFDEEKLSFPLFLRRKKEGDEFYPIHFLGKKKISKFFKDEKMSILAKQKTWLLVDSQDCILGVIPQRQDRRFAKTDNTKHILTIYNEKNNEV